MFTPNDDIMESRRTISRRRALGVGGTVGLAGLIAACAPGTKTTNTAASTSTNAFATSTTSVAAAAANEQKLRELLNAAPGCVTTPTILMWIPSAAISPRTALVCHWSL